MPLNVMSASDMGIGEAGLTAIFGSAGHVKRFDVPDKEAAMIMAIVADQLKKPLNELHFVSIKEVKEDEV